MRRRSLVFVLGSIAVACASTEAATGDRGGPTEEVIVPAAPDAALDGTSPEAEARPCSDCEYFPEVCTADTLCSNGPFDPSTSGGSFDGLAQVNAIRARSPSDVWVAGSLGSLAHFDGTSWTRSDFGRPDTVLALWLRESTEIAVGVSDNILGAQRLFARGPNAPEVDAGVSPGGWRPFSTPLPPLDIPQVQITSAWAAGNADSLWAVVNGNPSSSGLLRLRATPPSTFELGLGPNIACTPGCTGMNGIHGASAVDLWAVGAGGTAIRITDAESETPTLSLYNSRTLNSLNAVWAASSSDAWSVGASGTLRHYVGRPHDWDAVPDSPTTAHLNAVWGSSPSDVWAVGDSATVLHYDGTSWSRVKVAGLGQLRPNLTAVWVPTPGHVWIGGQGVFLSLGGKP